MKEKGWEILDTTFAKVDQFRRTMPLITDLKNHAMRPRHWGQLKQEVAKQFEEESPEFTLEKIIEFGFDSHAEFINEVSGSATKELAIELVWTFNLPLIGYLCYLNYSTISKHE